MSWVFVNDRAPGTIATGSTNQMGSVFNSDNLIADNPLLAKGSLLVEFDLSAEGRVPARLLDYGSDHDWLRRFTVYLNADYSVSVEAQQGPARSYACLTNWQVHPTGRVRLTYTWDAPAKLGLLTIECLESGTINQVLFDAPVPLPMCDASKIISGGPTTQCDPRVQSLAVSDAIEPIGPTPSIAGGTMVETSNGPRAVERVQLGDRVLTARNGEQAVRWIVAQDLPASGGFRPIKLRAPYLGLTRDIVVAQNQRIMISGAEAEYLFGEDVVLVEARQMLGHPAASLLPAEPCRRYYQLLLDTHDCICLNGAWSESLFIGRLADSPSILATSRLARLPRSAMPVHRKSIGPNLRNYETRTLLDALSA